VSLSWAGRRWFAVGGVPAALIGGFFFASAPRSFLDATLASIPDHDVLYRHIVKASMLRIPMGELPSWALYSVLFGTLG